MCMPMPETLRSGEQRRHGSSAGCPGLVSPAPHAHAAAPLPFDAAAKEGEEFLKRRREGWKTERGGKVLNERKWQEENRGEEKDGNLSLYSLPPPFGSTPPPS